MLTSKQIKYIARLPFLLAAVLTATGLQTQTSNAANTGKVIVSNEKSSTLSILNEKHELVATIDTCGRPRGMHFSKDRTQFYVGCADDSIVAIYDVETLELSGRILNVAAPETFDLHPNGRHLYISNEEDATATLFDIESGEQLSEYETGEEPEGVQITSDGKLVFVASEVADLVHVIDTAQDKVIADILVDTRPRRFALTPDEKELWVSAELAGIVNIINTESLKLVADIAFLPTGFRKEQVTPVDVLITRDGQRAYVALGRANHIAIVDVPDKKVIDYILVGNRAWGLALNHAESILYVANGLSDDVSVIDLEKMKVLVSVRVGLVPYGILVDDH